MRSDTGGEPNLQTLWVLRHERGDEQGQCAVDRLYRGTGLRPADRIPDPTDQASGREKGLSDRRQPAPASPCSGESLAGATARSAVRRTTPPANSRATSILPLATSPRPIPRHIPDHHLCRMRCGHVARLNTDPIKLGLPFANGLVPDHDLFLFADDVGIGRQTGQGRNIRAHHGAGANNVSPPRMVGIG